MADLLKFIKIINNMQTKKFDLYIGLDTQGKDTIQDINKIKNRAVEYFNSDKINYSLSDLIGGYVFEDKNYVIEKCLKITVIGDYTKEDAIEFAEYVKSDYLQESVLVDISNIEVNYE